MSEWLFRWPTHESLLSRCRRIAVPADCELAISERHTPRHPRDWSRCVLSYFDRQLLRFRSELRRFGDLENFRTPIRLIAATV